MEEQEQLEILIRFAVTILENTEKLDPEFEQALAEHFWNLYEKI